MFCFVYFLKQATTLMLKSATTPWPTTPWPLVCIRIPLNDSNFRRQCSKDPSSYSHHSIYLLAVFFLHLKSIESMINTWIKIGHSLLLDIGHSLLRRFIKKHKHNFLLRTKRNKTRLWWRYFWMDGRMSEWSKEVDLRSSTDICAWVRTPLRST